jgi:RNA polymerase-binding transcription factor DksA
MAEQSQGGGSEGDALEARQRDIEELKRFEQDTTFQGDQSEAFDELSAYDQHPADIGTETFQRELDATILGVLNKDEAQVQAAQERQRAGTYGVCANCGRPISAERHQARPEATLCIDCQRNEEQNR